MGEGEKQGFDLYLHIINKMISNIYSDIHIIYEIGLYYTLTPFFFFFFFFFLSDGKLLNFQERDFNLYLFDVVTYFWP